MIYPSYLKRCIGQPFAISGKTKSKKNGMSNFIVVIITLSPLLPAASTLFPSVPVTRIPRSSTF